MPFSSTLKIIWSWRNLDQHISRYSVIIKNIIFWQIINYGLSWRNPDKLENGFNLIIKMFIFRHIKIMVLEKSRPTYQLRISRYNITDTVFKSFEALYCL